MPEPGTGSINKEATSSGQFTRVGTARLRLIAGILLPAATAILLLALAGRSWPDNHILFIILIGLLAVLMAALLFRSFNQPLSDLTKAAQRIALGDLESQIPETRDEFGALAGVINAMTAEMRRYQTTMQTTIAQQTAELANASLQAINRASQLHAITGVTQAISDSRLSDSRLAEDGLYRDVLNHDPGVLLRTVSQMIGAGFGYRYVGIYLLDPTGEWAVLQANNLESGPDSEQQGWPAPGDKIELKASGLLTEAIHCGEARYALHPLIRQAGVISQAGVLSQQSAFHPAEASTPAQMPHTRLALPLKASARVIGAIDIYASVTGSEDPLAYHKQFGDDVARREQARLAEDARLEEDLIVLNTLASLLAMAVENARLFHEYSYSLAEIQTLHRQTLQEAWTRVVNEGKRSGYIYQNGKLSRLQETVRSSTDQAGLVVPVTVRGQEIGMLNLGEPGQGRIWTEEEISLVKTVADQIGLAMENARLLDETSRRAEREHQVSEITSRLRESNDPDVILQTAANELRKALRAARAQILISPEKEVGHEE